MTRLHALPLALLAVAALAASAADAPKTSPAVPAPADISEQLQKIVKDGSDKLSAASVIGEPDRDFASLMKLHHEQGIRLAEAYLKGGRDEKVRALARRIVTMQKEEIREFDEWLAGDARQPGWKR
jgi:uncharacterized protein (DUF305 family)